MADMDEAIDFGDVGTFSLADIAGASFDDTEAKKPGSRFPKCVAKWRVVDAHFDTFGDGENKKAVIVNKLECIDVESVADSTIDAGDLIGKEFNHIQFLSNPAENLGHQKQFMEDVGFTGTGSWGENLQNFAGTEFLGAIVHRKNKNDPDNPYSNLDTNTVQPAGQFAAAAPAEANAAPAAAPANPLAAAS